jgi:hypothetical protein
MKRIDMIIDAIDEGVSFDYEVRKTAKGRTKVVLKNNVTLSSLRAATVQARRERLTREREVYRMNKAAGKKVDSPAQRRDFLKSLPELSLKEKEKLLEVNAELRKRNAEGGGRKAKGGENMRLTSIRARSRKKNEGRGRLNDAFRNTLQWSEGRAHAKNVDAFIEHISLPENQESKNQKYMADWGDFVNRLRYWKNHITDEALVAMHNIWYNWYNENIDTATANAQFNAALDAGISERPRRKPRRKRKTTRRR